MVAAGPQVRREVRVVAGGPQVRREVRVVAAGPQVRREVRVGAAGPQVRREVARRGCWFCCYGGWGRGERGGAGGTITNCTCTPDHHPRCNCCLLQGPLAHPPKHYFIRMFASSHLLVLYLVMCGQLSGLRPPSEQWPQWSLQLQLLGLWGVVRRRDVLPVLLSLVVCTLQAVMGAWLARRPEYLSQGGRQPQPQQPVEHRGAAGVAQQQQQPQQPGEHWGAAHVSAHVSAPQQGGCPAVPSPLPTSLPASRTSAVPQAVAAVAGPQGAAAAGRWEGTGLGGIGDDVHGGVLWTWGWGWLPTSLGFLLLYALGCSLALLDTPASGAAISLLTCGYLLLLLCILQLPPCRCVCVGGGMRCRGMLVGVCLNAVCSCRGMRVGVCGIIGGG